MPYRWPRPGYRARVHTLGPDVRWSPVSADADAVLRSQLQSRYGVAARVGRLCASCGSSEHGRPWAWAGDHEVPVSVSRSGAHLVTVLGEAGARRIGVDVEFIDQKRTWPIEVMLAEGEVVNGALATARLWARKEAILKCLGVGLDRPMRELRVADFKGDLIDVEAPVGYVAAIALVR